MSSVLFRIKLDKVYQSSRYSTGPCQWSAPLMSVCSCSASLTVLSFLTLQGTHLKTFGAKFSRQHPFSQRSVQKRVFLLLPNVVLTDITNIAAVLEYTGICRPPKADPVWSSLTKATAFEEPTRWFRGSRYLAPLDQWVSWPFPKPLSNCHH